MRRVARTLLVLGAVAAVAGPATFSAFSATTDDAGNGFDAGTVSLADNDGGTRLFALTGQKPGVTTSRCLKVTYGGTLPASVRLYGSASGALAPYLLLTVTRGTESAPAAGCGGFSPDSTDYAGHGPGVVWKGKLSAYPASYAAGTVDPTASWGSGDSRSYRLVVEVEDADAAQGQSATASFTWEARNR